MLFKLDGTQKDNFYDRLFNIVRKLGEQEILVIAGHLNGHVGVNAEKEFEEHRGYGYGEGILEFCAAMTRTVRKTIFKKTASHLIIHESVPAKSKVDVVRGNQRKFLNDIKVSPSEKCITQYKPLLCDFKIRKIKNTIKFVPRKKIWKLHEDNVKSDFS